MSIFKDWNARQKYNWQEYHKRATKEKTEISEKSKQKFETPKESEILEQSEITEKSDTISIKSENPEISEMIGTSKEPEITETSETSNISATEKTEPAD